MQRIQFEEMSSLGRVYPEMSGLSLKHLSWNMIKHYQHAFPCLEANILCQSLICEFVLA